MMGDKMNRKIVVVGGGILGASIALNLFNNKGDENIEVCIVESETMEAGGGAGGATSKSWAWLNANRKTPRHYKDLSVMSMNLWRLSPEAVFKGSLVLSNQSSEELSLFDDPTYPAVKVTASQSESIEPHLNPELKVSNRFFFPLEGLVDPIAYTESLWRKARSHGATFMFGKSVTDFVKSGSKITGVILDSGEQVLCDVVVLATGCDTSSLAKLAGVEVSMEHRPGLLVHTHPLPLLIHRVVVADDVYVLQRPDGSVVVGDDMGPDGNFGSNEEEQMEYARKMMLKAAKLVPALKYAQIRSAEMGYRPYPADGLPVCGFVPNVQGLYLAVAHSGVTLAPILGQHISKEIIEKQDSHILQPYRLEGRNFKDNSNTYDVQFHGWKSQTDAVQRPNLLAKL
mmetsp:Transcript_5111/g.7066  ORF Transcript_5111/g.7066 Transcript_5111/m.7066 type:complete len:399 (-) Transcript_5111:530-1726(-)